MEQQMTGYFASSLAGHDKKKVYIIMKEEAEYVYLADGKYKTCEKLKKKSKKHIQIIKKGADEALRQRLLSGEMVRNEEIKHAIRLYVNDRTIEEV